MEWTTPTVLYVSLLFFAAGLAEIGGGWLVWQAARENQPRWWAVAGSIILMIYGFLPTLQPLDDFGRLYAVYGGVFIGMSFAWGYLVDGIVPDRGDIVGSIVAALGVAIVLFWPRDAASLATMSERSTSVITPLGESARATRRSLI
ncbi:hypothetical protein EMIHUDRAFT_463817 [Emiliania huxleyi CCMP1516]|uniref:Uncharacterized protein n=2 Tax=Emiliania huxleyi TaxID=2903 RepID=A0A0D3JBV0_EMIH1|nr:hypothetical protein EMIHUDRAFT_463817 [Emiliania huxleyi CCMP1516]EOD20985.1 hypothetical protein EMIHUDRAFT_463817 [Emiliania huxleyi CCMP1516]|eukprot:XP_005773414.1 hypothetical protein EMIHUDRAFT_463817 [Emiliania huxleyi CCMP1516]